MKTILAIDQGTTGTTCLLIDADGRVRGRGYAEFPQHFPHLRLRQILRSRNLKNY